MGSTIGILILDDFFCFVFFQNMLQFHLNWKEEMYYSFPLALIAVERVRVRLGLGVLRPRWCCFHPINDTVLGENAKYFLLFGIKNCQIYKYWLLAKSILPLLTKKYIYSTEHIWVQPNQSLLIGRLFTIRTHFRLDSHLLTFVLHCGESKILHRNSDFCKFCL